MYITVICLLKLQEFNLSFNSIILAEMADDVSLSFYPSPFLQSFKEIKLRVKLLYNLIPVEPIQQIEYNQSLLVLKSDTLSSVRSQIADKLGLNPLSFKIKRCINGVELKDGSLTIESLDLTNESIIH